MKALLKKEFALCLHPTSFIFLCFCLFVFIPNYPYEVMFFFSGLSVFFICLTARENDDATLSCTLPVSKGSVAKARMVLCMLLQAALLLLAGIATAVKQLAFPVEAQVNLSGLMANMAFLGEGAMLLGVFNLIFFPMYFRDVRKVGVPFLVASAVVFVLIGLSITLRFALPFVRDVVNTPDPSHLAVKLAILLSGLCLYGVFSWIAMAIGTKNFIKNDLA